MLALQARLLSRSNEAHGSLRVRQILPHQAWRRSNLNRLQQAHWACVTTIPSVQMRNESRSRSCEKEYPKALKWHWLSLKLFHRRGSVAEPFA